MKNQSKNQLEKDIDKIIKYCQKIENKMNAGSAVFYPEKEDEYIYKEMVVRNLMIKSPAGKGYMLKEGYEKIWGGDPVEKIVTRENQPKI